jgi:hypothetical protein
VRALRNHSPQAQRRESHHSLSSPRGLLKNRHRGSLLLEAIIAIGIFALFLGGMGFSLILGERSTIAAGDHARASFLAEQELEAVRAMRAQDFSSVSPGTHGVVLTATGWTFSGNGVVRNNYHTNVDVVSRGTDWVEVTANVAWNFGQTRSGALAITTYLTDWQKISTVGNWASVSRISLTTISGTPEFQKVVVAGNYAYVTSNRSAGGKGLYILDITNPAAPIQVASAFDLGASAYGLAVSGEYLYLATDDPAREVQIYDITSPSTLESSNLINSFDLPGEGQARSITVYGTTIFVGTLNDTVNNQLFALEMSALDPVVLLGSLNMSGSVLDLNLHEGYAYAAMDTNSAELEVVDIFDPENLSFAPGVGRDLTEVQDATAIATSGTAALIGRIAGTSIDELTMFSLADSPVPTPPPGPWTMDTGGDVLSLAIIDGNSFAFIGGTMDGAQLRVIDTLRLEHNQSPTLTTYDTEATIRGLFYDWQKDRLYSVTPSSLFVFAPG